MYLNETFNALKMDKMEQWIKHFQNWPKSHIICFHSEEHTLAAVLFLAELYDRKVHICHVSTKEDILLIKAAKEKGIKVTCEVAPHHLFFSKADLNQFNTQMKEVRPKLKTEEDRKAIWDLLDWIDVIASDHAPHTIEEKQQNSMPGFPGLETSLPLLITAYKQGKISMEAIIQKCYTNPKRIFDLPEQTNTYIEVDLDTEWTIPNEMPFSKCKWTPFAGLKVFGLVRRVILRGEVVYVDGQILVKPGYGKNIASVSRKEVKLSGPKVELKNEIIPPKLVISSEQDVDLLNDKNITQPTNSPSYLSELISKKKFYEPESPLKNSNLQLSPKMTSQFINSVLNENSINGIANARRKKLTSISNGLISNFE
jgi:carbamoyl-phosphate synthase / aspartate carbamoyltransferase / dihydroorotase